MKLTVICQEEGYPDILIYAVNVRDPADKAEVEDAIALERQRDLGDEYAFVAVTALVAFPGDLSPCADWRDDEPTDTDGDTSRWNENGEGSERENDRTAARANPEEN